MSNAVLSALSAAALVEVYNNLAAIVDSPDVKRFASKEKAVERVLRKLDVVNEYRYEEKLPLIEIAEGGKLVAIEPKPAPAPKPAPKPARVATPKPATAAKASPGRAAAVSPSDVIVLLVAAGSNPKFGSAAARFSKYASGIKVSDYFEAVGDKKQALRDLNWDAKKGWVKVVGAKSAAARAATAVQVAPAEEPGQLLLAPPAALLMLPAPAPQLAA